MNRTGIASVTTLAEVRARRAAPQLLRRAEAQQALPFVIEEQLLPATRPRLRLVTGPDDATERFATQFAQLLLEVLSGDRAVHHLLRWTTEEVLERLNWHAQTLARTAPPPRPGARRPRAQVRSVHVSRPMPGVAEVAMHVRHGARSRAIAAKLELVEGRWKCADLVLG